MDDDYAEDFEDFEIPVDDEAKSPTNKNKQYEANEEINEMGNGGLL